jgi:hypothetical protein
MHTLLAMHDVRKVWIWLGHPSLLGSGTLTAAEYCERQRQVGINGVCERQSGTDPRSAAQLTQCLFGSNIVRPKSLRSVFCVRQPASS